METSRNAADDPIFRRNADPLTVQNEQAAGYTAAEVPAADS
jgi:hypothetical protein